MYKSSFIMRENLIARGKYSKRPKLTIGIPDRGDKGKGAPLYESKQAFVTKGIVVCVLRLLCRIAFGHPFFRLTGFSTPDKHSERQL